MVHFTDQDKIQNPSCHCHCVFYNEKINLTKHVIFCEADIVMINSDFSKLFIDVSISNINITGGSWRYKENSTVAVKIGDDSYNGYKYELNYNCVSMYQYF